MDRLSCHGAYYNLTVHRTTAGLHRPICPSFSAVSFLRQLFAEVANPWAAVSPRVRDCRLCLCLCCCPAWRLRLATQVTHRTRPTRLVADFASGTMIRGQRYRWYDARMLLLQCRDQHSMHLRAL